jgi:acyl-CoA thioesterase-1
MKLLLKLMMSTCIITGAFAQSPPNGGPIQIVAFGASQTAGKIVSADQAYPAQLERRLKAEGINATVSNQGSSGDTTRDELNRLERSIPDGTQIVLFQPGSNDCGHRGGVSEGAAEKNINAMLSWMKNRHLQVLVLGSGCYEKLQAALPERYGFTYYGKMVRGLKDSPRPDGQHLTAEGYARLVDLLLPSVKQLILNLGSPTK